MWQTLENRQARRISIAKTTPVTFQSGLACVAGICRATIAEADARIKQSIKQPVDQVRRGFDESLEFQNLMATQAIFQQRFLRRPTALLNHSYALFLSFSL